VYYLPLLSIIDICIPKMNTAFFIKMLPRFLKRVLAIVHFKEICIENVWKRNVLTKKSRNGGRSKDLEGHLGERLSISALLLSEIGGHLPSMPLRSSACPEI
jgi:hypothetical protein